LDGLEHVADDVPQGGQVRGSVGLSARCLLQSSQKLEENLLSVPNRPHLLDLLSVFLGALEGCLGSFHVCGEARSLFAPVLWADALVLVVAPDTGQLCFGRGDLALALRDPLTSAPQR
jgi:hypothetical protein